ncbi:MULTISPECIES: phosphatidate cytidylyltransferase [Brachymonas]|uniref:phosphatidate cytidylyltransferase n=1 Tax=Brachymonas TaxID=28219 RepID=UPI002E78702D|nr:phosphatidate cytidylyltransferase [Brachymonas sp. J145]MEE1653994.1 phosphatidate cytidylyltransferase [Brachymonas sp. J145]
MLKQRIITAIILLIVLLGALFAPGHQAFSLLMALAIACAGWEWARLSGFSGMANILWALLAVAGCLLMGLAGWQLQASNASTALITLVSLLWLLSTPWLLRAGVPVWQRIPRWLRMTAGLLVLWATWLAIVQLLAQHGPWYLLSAMALVWVADIAAYFCGRAFGKRKLAPSISPGKSWAGAIGGALFVQLFALSCAWLTTPEQTVYADLAARSHLVIMLLAVLLLTVMSVTGDLVESLIKRSAGLKDSSQLLPGHGGVLDRIDALLPVMPITLALLLWLS